MKSIKGVIIGLTSAFLFANSGIGLGQETTALQDAFSGITLDASVPVSAEPFSMSAVEMPELRRLTDQQLQVFVNLLDATPTILFEDLPANRRAGTFYSLQHPDWPPLPCNPGQSPMWPMTDFYLLSDLNYRYGSPALSASADFQMLALDGSTNEDDLVSFQAQVFTTNDLWLQITSRSNSASSLVTHPPWAMAGSNSFFDVFATTNLLATVPGWNGTNWLLVTRSAPGQTNLTVTTLPGAPVCFYRLGTMLDSDGDSLTDAYEKLASHTNPNLWDSNGNGVGDGDEIGSGGLLWRLEAVRRSWAVIYANAPVATQGGACGQATVYLPSPAPAGGVTVGYRWAGPAVLNVDFTLAPAGGQLVIPAGNSSGVITLCAAGGSTYSDLDLYADLTLTNATSGPVDSAPARVSIVTTGLPGVRVFALPPWVRRPCPTYGTNVAGFYFIREGDSINALTVGLSTAGSTAVSGVDYTALPASINFPANVRTNWLPLSIIPSSTIPTNKTLTLTVTSAPGYQIDPSNATASVTIAATASPVLPVVQLTATVPDATTTTPGQFTFTRPFATASALRVYYQAWGNTNTVVASTNGQDTTIYAPLPGYVDILAGATSASVSLIVTHPLATVQTVTLVLAAGEYVIGANNMDTVYVDGAGPFGVYVNITRNGIYSASINQPAEIQVVRYGSALAATTMNWIITNQFSGPVIQGNRSGSFTWAARQSVVNLQISPLWATWPDAPVTPTLIFYNGTWGPASFFVAYEPPKTMFTVVGSASPASVVNKGATGYVTVGHVHPNGIPATVYLTVSGSAANGTDYSFGTTVNFSGYQGSTNVPFQAFNNAPALGWKTAVVSIGSYNSQVGQIGLDRTFVRIQDPQNSLSDTDLDGDGLPDGFELNNLASGFDPLEPDNPYVDADRDGLGLLEELILNSNPNAADAPPVYPSIDESDYSPLFMRVGAVGKMLKQPGGNCAVCHAVTLRAGNFIRSSAKTDWGHNPTTADYLIRFLRGTNYPVQVTCNPYYSSLLTSNAAQAVTTPKYTAAYIAQFMLATNGGAYPFIVDTNRLLGTNLPLVQEVLPKTATLYVPDLTIAADVDRTGVIDFKNRNDRTSTNNPFVFWTNDDADAGSDDAAADLDPSVSALNSANSSIDGLRDLEDFARLQFKIDGLPSQFLNNGNYQVKVYLTNLVGTPSLRLFPAADVNGGLGYLTDTAAASQQVIQTTLGVVTNGTPLASSSLLWKTAGSNNFFLPMLFEGISTGQCVISFGFSSNNAAPVALSRPFYLQLQKVTSLYEHWTVGDNTTTEWNQIQAVATNMTDSAVFGKPQKAEDLDYILLVHGWRMQPWERRAFASTAYKRLWHQNYKGRFGLFSWPTDWVNLGSSHLLSLSFWTTTGPNGLMNLENFDVSEQRAWNSGAALLNVLEKLRQTEPPNRVRLTAHSMGNVVAGETLRLATDSQTKGLIHTYVALEGALASHSYDSNAPVRPLTAVLGLNNDSGTFNLHRYFWKQPSLSPGYDTWKPYLHDVNAAGRLINYFSPSDAALFGWRFNQDLKPDWDWYYSLHGFGKYMPLATLDGYGDRYEIFARAVEARCFAMGAQANLGGPFQLNQVDLQASFGFTDSDSDHSAEFNSTIQRRAAFWAKLILDFDF